MSNINKRLEAIEAALAENSAKRDALVLEARELSAERAMLQTQRQLLAMPESPIKAKILQAAGIPSAERVMGK